MDFGVLGRELVERGDELGVAFGALFDKLLVDEVFFDDDMRHRAEHGDIGARLERQPQFGEVDQFDAARVDDDHLCAVLFDRFLHLERDDGMVLGGVRAGDDEDIV